MKFDTLFDNPELLDVMSEIHSETWPAFLSEACSEKPNDKVDLET